jgi:pimeloyl-ACP methyl ester carboxylesterase
MGNTRLVLIPGMGADPRLFDGMALTGHTVVRTNWIPHHSGEGLRAYAARFAEHYGMSSDDIIIGVSMGGIVASSIAQAITPRQLILISTCTHIRQLSPLLSMFSRIGPISPFEVARWLPAGLMPDHRKLALEMFEAQDMGFIRWACGAIMRWPGAPRLPGSVTIHGTADRVFPIRRQPHVDIAIPGGGHLMVMDRPAEVESAILRSMA